jgi:hypothetical protein
MTDEERLRLGMSRHDFRVQASLKEHEGMWAQYVREFIERYRLNDEQSQKAMAILAGCQRRADQVLARQKPQLTALVLKLEEARKRGERTALRELTDQINGLREPINKIFQTELKPRLEPLPTRAQREAAERSARSRSQAIHKP